MDRSPPSENEFEKKDVAESEEDDELSLPSSPPVAKLRGPSVNAFPAQGADNEDIIDFIRERHESHIGSLDDEDDDADDSHSHAHDHQVPPYRVYSRTQSSVRSIRRDAVKVPLDQRRGLFARCSVIAEVTNPYDYPRRMKWIITTVVALAASAAPMGSSIVLPGLQGIIHDLHATPSVANLSVAMYMLAMSIFPLWWSTFSETLGRRTIYLISFTLFAIFNIIAGLSVNIAMFVVIRMLAGGAAASVQAVGAGTIADIWEVKERGRAMGMFYLGPLCGPLIAPILGGVFAETLGWRSAMYYLAIFGACLVLMILLCLPETLRVRKSVAAEAEQEAVAETVLGDEKGEDRPGLSRTTTRQSVKIKSRKYLNLAQRMLIDPLRIVLYLQFPSLALCVMYASVTFSSLYMLNISVQETFSRAPYNYTSIIVGLLYIPNSVGYFITSMFGGRWVDSIMHREARKAGRYDEKGRLKFLPEDRMQENAWLAALLYPSALLIYGWTADYHVSIAVPMIANFFFGVGSMLIFAVATTMLTEYMPRKASNGVALNNFVRNICACILVAVTEPLINAIGNGWLFTIVSLFAMVSGFGTLWAMKRYGNHWRTSMDKKMAQVMGE